MTAAETFLAVDGLKIRYAETGSGPIVLLLHGASLGSSADVWELSLRPLAGQGFRVIAFDQPGFGLSDDPPDPSVAYRRQFVLRFMDTLRIGRAHLIGHSQAGRLAVTLAREHPARISKIVVLGTGSLLPPLGEDSNASGQRDGDDGTTTEPTLEDTRALLEATLYHHSVITPEILATRYRMSIGKNFRAFCERSRAAERSGPASTSEDKGSGEWKRLDQVPVPMLLLYGRQDRGSPAERALIAKRRFPALDLHLIDRCKHFIQMDAVSEFVALTAEFLKRDAGR